MDNYHQLNPPVNAYNSKRKLDFNDPSYSSQLEKKQNTKKTKSKTKPIPVGLILEGVGNLYPQDQSYIFRVCERLGPNGETYIGSAYDA